MLRPLTCGLLGPAASVEGRLKPTCMIQYGDAFGARDTVPVSCVMFVHKAGALVAVWFVRWQV